MNGPKGSLAWERETAWESQLVPHTCYPSQAVSHWYLGIRVAYIWSQFKHKILEWSPLVTSENNWAVEACRWVLCYYNLLRQGWPQLTWPTNSTRPKALIELLDCLPPSPTCTGALSILFTCGIHVGTSRAFTHDMCRFSFLSTQTLNRGPLPTPDCLEEHWKSTLLDFFHIRRNSLPTLLPLPSCFWQHLTVVLPHSKRA